MDWEHLFREIILDRGYDYYLSGAIKNMKISDHQIQAIVEGSDDYEVEINFHNNHITDMYCSCPYAEDGHNCKHMAAVLYKWEEDENFTIQDQDFIYDEANNVEDVINQATNEQIHDFLLDILDKDERLFIKFKTLVAPSLDVKDILYYKRQVDVTVQTYLGRDHFISYYEANDFISEMENYLHDDVQRLIDEELYWYAYELSMYIFVKVGQVDMDDSDGGTSLIANECTQIWHEILDHADKQTEAKIFQSIQEHLDDCVIDYMQDYIEKIFMERFLDEEFLKDKLIFVKQKIEQIKDDSESFYASYEREKWILRYVQLMESLNYSIQDINQYCKGHWECSRIREYYINKCIEQQNYNEAIDILKESMMLDNGFRGLISDYSTKLKELYKLIGDEENYKKQLWQLVIKDRPANIEDFNELKSLYSQEEWIHVREDIFKSLADCSNIDKLYLEEKLYDRLLEYALHVEDLYVVDEYFDILKELYPQELIQKYTDELNRLASYTSNRKIYQMLVKYLRQMNTIKGGNQKVQEIVYQWRMKYRNRRAMMDELNRL